MARYIDANKAIEVIINTPSMVGAKYDFDHNVLTALVDREHEITDLINNNVPTEDVSPVVHAYWIGGDYGDWFCSKCDSVLRLYGESKHLRYCYRCGAKMDGEVET